jgi:imidazoleglycerol-phosphate dehydratase
MTARTAKTERNTAETQIKAELNLDGSGKKDIQTGIPFFDHMLELFTWHGRFDLTLRATGDLAVDYHHTVEDVGLVLGQLFREALGDRRGIRRYGSFLLPMDEALVLAAVDLSNRPYLVVKPSLNGQWVRDFHLALLPEFFQAFVNQGGLNLHLNLQYGSEPHHIAEAMFKGLARALRVAIEIEPGRESEIPSTKGKLV